MRVALYHGIVTRLEIRASEKHEKEIVRRAVNPQSAHMYQCSGGRRTGKCSEMHTKTPPLQMLGIFFIQEILDRRESYFLILIFGPGLSTFECSLLL